MGIMIIPMVSTLSEDAMNAVPMSLKEAAYGLGAKKYQVALRVVFPSAISGIVASFILAISRAIGETMIVSLAAGGKPALTLNPLDEIQTMTAYIVTVSQGETPQGSVEYNSIFAVGLLLFLLTLIMNLIGRFNPVKNSRNPTSLKNGNELKPRIEIMPIVVIIEINPLNLNRFKTKVSSIFLLPIPLECLSIKI